MYLLVMLCIALLAVTYAFNYIVSVDDDELATPRTCRLGACAVTSALCRRSICDGNNRCQDVTEACYLCSFEVRSGARATPQVSWAAGSAAAVVARASDGDGFPTRAAAAAAGAMRNGTLATCFLRERNSTLEVTLAAPDLDASLLPVLVFVSLLVCCGALTLCCHVAALLVRDLTQPGWRRFHAPDPLLRWVPWPARPPCGGCGWRLVVSMLEPLPAIPPPEPALAMNPNPLRAGAGLAV
jgi:hypothetical protein